MQSGRSKSREASLSFHLTSLGCAKNRVDSEVVLADLLGRGFLLSQEREMAEIIVVNTCAFIQPAVEEAIDHLLAAAKLKEKGRARWVVGLGCLPERYGPDLARQLPEVDLFVGASALHRAGQAIQALARGHKPRLIRSSKRFLYCSATPRTLTTPAGSAYLKIAEGCPNRCAFCTIPAIRGRQRSRPIEDIVKEIEKLASLGVVEVNLVAQDLTAYGQDLKPPASLSGLLQALEVCRPAPAWIRLLYLNPARLDQALLDQMAKSSRLLPYLDLPLQHASPRLLKKMGRKPPDQDLLKWLGQIRRGLPKAVIRTSLMVGYPTETEAEFEALLDFVSQARFEHLGGFVFWPEEGVRAARMAGQVPAKVAQERLARLMELQARISLEHHRGRVGQKVDVLIEGLHPESELLLVGRAWFQAPEADGQVIVRAGFGQVGAIQPARVVAAHPYDLVVELVGAKANRKAVQLNDPVV